MWQENALETGEVLLYQKSNTQQNMKKLLTISLLLTSLSAFAFNADKKALDKTATTTTVTAESATVALLSQLQLENKLLKAKLEQLEQLNEENQSQIHYQQIMLAVVQNLSKDSFLQTMEEMNAKMSFEKTMANMLLNLSRK